MLENEISENKNIENIKLIVKKTQICNNSSIESPMIGSNILILPKIINIKDIIYLISNKIIIIIIILFIIYLIYKFINILKEKLK